MKRFVSILYCLMFISSLTACGSEGNKQQPDGTQSIIDTRGEENGKEPDISVSAVSSDGKAADMPIRDSLTEQLNETEAEDDTVKKMNIQIGDTVFTATLERNPAVTEFIEMMREAPVVVPMSDYSGFEKVGSLGTSLTAVDNQITTQSGDIVLYNGNQIVIFYGTNSWSYTRLGKVDDLSGWEEALGSSDVQVTFSVVE